MTPVFNRADEVAEFVARGIFSPGRGFGAASAIGFKDNDELVAGVVFHNYEPECGVVEMSAYAKRQDWLNRARLKLIYGYPFDQLKCRIAVARYSQGNARVGRIWRALGAQEIVLPDMRADGENEILALLKREAWHSSKFAR